MKQDIKEQLLTKRPIDLLFQLSIPAVIGMIVIGLYPLMDGIFAGKIIGQTVMGEYAIEGAALATITAQFVQAAVTLHYFLKKSKVVKIHKIQSDAEIKKEMFSVGSSAMRVVSFA